MITIPNTTNKSTTISQSTPKKRGRPPKSTTAKNVTHTETSSTQNTQDVFYELCAAVDFFSQSDSGSNLQDIKLTDLYKYLRNPQANIQSIRNVSKYLSNKHGVIKDVLRTIKTLPSLNYHLTWSTYDEPQLIREKESLVYDFLDTINVKKFVRDGLYEVSELGTVVVCNRKNKYIQFLDIDELRIETQRNSKWIVEYDLDNVKKGTSNVEEIQAKINSLPDEITLAKYNKYTKNRDKKLRYVELPSCDVVNIDANRNSPFGLPYTLPAWSAILQKDLISQVERSVSDRLLKQILILTAGQINDKPAPKELIDFYFKQVSNLVQKKQTGRNTSASDSSGTGVIAFPDIFKLDTLDIDTTFFPKEMYDKINKDLFMNLGVSPALISGQDSDYSSSQINTEKLFRYIYSILEDFERVINSYIKKILPEGLSCTFYFDKTTSIDKDKMIAAYKELYMQTGVAIPWLEALSSQPYNTIVGMKKYQDKVLKLDDLFNPPLNAYTTSGGDNPKAGRPVSDNSQNPNTNKSRTNDSNSVPSPSDN